MKGEKILPSWNLYFLSKDHACLLVTSLLTIHSYKSIQKLIMWPWAVWVQFNTSFHKMHTMCTKSKVTHTNFFLYLHTSLNTESWEAVCNKVMIYAAIVLNLKLKIPTKYFQVIYLVSSLVLICNTYLLAL